MEREDSFLEFRGVKKRVKRLGVMGGGRLGFRLPEAACGAGGDEEKSSGVGSCSRKRAAHGEEDILLVEQI